MRGGSISLITLRACSAGGPGLAQAAWVPLGSLGTRCAGQQIGPRLTILDHAHL